ncbi:MAG: hypothetical protein LBL33_04605 [Tannerella sp.]|jgi:hypothetical protein|nr:hypothetical protein [Tannerella sp.]
MKKISIIILLLSLFFAVNAQTIVKKLGNGITTVSTPRGAKTDVPTPSLLSKIFRIRTSPFSQDVVLKLYMEEYVNGQKVKSMNPYNLDLLFQRKYNKGDRGLWEIIPDISIKEELHLFVNTPGITVHREKKTVPLRYFAYNIYRNSDETLDIPIPVLLIYEDDYQTKDNMNVIQKYTVQDSLRTDVNENFFLEIERCFFIYYKLSIPSKQ